MPLTTSTPDVMIPCSHLAVDYPSDISVGISKRPDFNARLVKAFEKPLYKVWIADAVTIKSQLFFVSGTVFETFNALIPRPVLRPKEPESW